MYSKFSYGNGLSLTTNPAVYLSYVQNVFSRKQESSLTQSINVLVNRGIPWFALQRYQRKEQHLPW